MVALAFLDQDARPFLNGAPFKSILASCRYRIRKLDVQLMTTYMCETLTDVKSMDYHVRLLLQSRSMNETLVEVTQCKIAHRSQ